MSKRWKPQIKNRAYRGITAAGPQGKPDERGLYELRPLRFALFDGASAIETLERLVNLPDDATAPEVMRFIEKVHNLALGGTASTGRNAPQMPPQEVLRLRGLYRQFWEVSDGRYRSMLFMQLIGPWFGLADYNASALQMDWKAGQFKIVARGPVDWLTHAIFQNRNRLRKCDGCGRLFVASGPNESLCSPVCKLEASRERKRKWWGRSRVKRLTVSVTATRATRRRENGLSRGRSLRKR